MGKPIIDDEWRFGSDDTTLFKLVRGEIPEQTMPNVIGKAMTDDEVWKTLVYVRSVFSGDPGTIKWTVPPVVPPEKLAAATQQTGDPVAAGKQLFMQICSTCHGPEGKGDGPASAALEPKPRNLTDPTVMAPMSERYLFELISRGGIAVGKSPLMPPQSGLAALEIGHIIAYVKTLSASPPK
jgi:mono/diheme cytochrome c family protein